MTEKEQKGVIKFCKIEESVDFKGWDFSHIVGRCIDGDPKWDYHQIVTQNLSGVNTLLDMGTGGGERLSSFAPLPANTYATESYPPNYPIAVKRLSPFNVKVVATADNDVEPLPFESDFFDLVINCHESYDPAEVLRVLKKGGRFITQQVGGQNCKMLNEWLDVPNSLGMPDWNREHAVGGLSKIGFNVLKGDEDFPFQRFLDIGAVAYYAKIIKWQFPDFSVERCKNSLLKIAEQIKSFGYFEVKSHRFIIVAQK